MPKKKKKSAKPELVRIQNIARQQPCHRAGRNRTILLSGRIQFDQTGLSSTERTKTGVFDGDKNNKMWERKD